SPAPASLSRPRSTRARSVVSPLGLSFVHRRSRRPARRRRARLSVLIPRSNAGRGPPSAPWHRKRHPRRSRHHAAVACPLLPPSPVFAKPDAWQPLTPEVIPALPESPAVFEVATLVRTVLSVPQHQR